MKMWKTTGDVIEIAQATTEERLVYTHCVAGLASKIINAWSLQCLRVLLNAHGVDLEIIDSHRGG